MSLTAQYIVPRCLAHSWLFGALQAIRLPSVHSMSPEQSCSPAARLGVQFPIGSLAHPDLWPMAHLVTAPYWLFAVLLAAQAFSTLWHWTLDVFLIEQRFLFFGPLRALQAYRRPLLDTWRFRTGRFRSCRRSKESVERAA